MFNIRSFLKESRDFAYPCCFQHSDAHDYTKFLATEKSARFLYCDVGYSNYNKPYLNISILCRRRYFFWMYRAKSLLSLHRQALKIDTRQKFSKDGNVTPIIRSIVHEI